MSERSDPSVLVSVRELRTHFPILRGLLKREGGRVRALDGVSFDVHRGETLGLVGESGSGKSTLGRSLLRLIEPTSGRVVFDGEDVTALDAEALRRSRRHMQMVFQDPYASLNPRMRVGDSVREPLDIHDIGSPAGRDVRVAELLEQVGLAPDVARRYPHQFSGGQRQRIGIARALATEPRFIVADEPISALDVSIQAQVVNLLAALGAKLGLTYLFIAHDLAMVRYLCDRVAVLYLGRIVELSDASAVFGSPRHPYTRGLLSSIPVPDPTAQRRTLPLRGEIPNPAAPPSGCAFHPRCPHATDRCRTERPELRDLGGPAAPHTVACHHAEDLA